MHDVVDDSVSDLMELISLQGDVKAQRRPGQPKGSEGGPGPVRVGGHVRLPPHISEVVRVMSALPPLTIATRTMKAARKRGFILSGSDLVRDGGREEHACCGTYERRSIVQDLQSD